MYTYKKQQDNNYIILKDNQWYITLNAQFNHNETRIQTIINALNLAEQINHTLYLGEAWEEDDLKDALFNLLTSKKFAATEEIEEAGPPHPTQKLKDIQDVISDYYSSPMEGSDAVWMIKGILEE